jgi:pheromone shutdown protein TraB
MYRINCFEGTFVHLTERFNDKEVYLVGSANQSTMLAQRTQKLIQEVQPDAVLVQTNEQWWDTAKML